MHTAKTQISLGICPVWSVFIVRMKTYLSLRWSCRSFCWFCQEAAQLNLHTYVPKEVWTIQAYSNVLITFLSRPFLLLVLSLLFYAERSSWIGSVSAWHASGPEFDPHIRHILSWKLGHEKISVAILPLPLIQEEQLSVTGERMCTKYW